MYLIVSFLTVQTKCQTELLCKSYEWSKFQSYLEKNSKVKVLGKIKRWHMSPLQGWHDSPNLKWPVIWSYLHVVQPQVDKWQTIGSIMVWHVAIENRWEATTWKPPIGKYGLLCIKSDGFDEGQTHDLHNPSLNISPTVNTPCIWYLTCIWKIIYLKLHKGLNGRKKAEGLSRWPISHGHCNLI